MNEGLLKRRADKIRESLHPIMRQKHDALLKALGGFWYPYCGYRSFVDQDALFEIGRTRQIGSAPVTNVKGGESAHQYGIAEDWACFAPDMDPWSDADWTKFEKAVTDVGLVWGGNFRSLKDKPHVQLDLSIDLGSLYDHYRVYGASACEALITQHYRGK